MQFFPGEGYSGASVASLAFKASKFVLVEEIVRKLAMQLAQDELDVLVVVPSQGCHGEQQFRERPEKMASLGSQFEFLQSFVPVGVGAAGP